MEVKGRKVGHIKGFHSNSAQDYLEIHRAGSNFSIPFIPDYIESLNFSKRHIKLTLPSGFPGLSDE